MTGTGSDMDRSSTDRYSDLENGHNHFEFKVEIKSESELSNDSEKKSTTEPWAEVKTEVLTQAEIKSEDMCSFGFETGDDTLVICPNENLGQDDIEIKCADLIGCEEFPKMCTIELCHKMGTFPSKENPESLPMLGPNPLIREVGPRYNEELKDSTQKEKSPRPDTQLNGDTERSINGENKAMAKTESIIPGMVYLHIIDLGWHLGLTMYP